MLADAEFLRRFEQVELSSDEFGHYEHVRMAWLYLRAHPLPAALARISDGIRRFAAAHGADGLYHETITVAFALLICGRIADGEQSWAEFAGANADLFEPRLAALRRYYSDELLASAEAKRRFCWPDKLVQSAT